MSKLFDDLKETLDTPNDDFGSYAADLMYGEDYGWPLDDVSLELIDSYGGEDQGSDFWSVFKFTRGDEECYIKFEGWYASHYGSEFEQYYEVNPKQKTVTVYE